MKNYFEKIENLSPERPRRSVYPLDHSRTQTQSLGALTPSFFLEVVPGDTIKFGTSVFGRANSMLAPIMHNVDIHTQYFYVPYRICSDNFSKMVNDPRDSTAILPNVSLSEVITHWATFGNYFNIGSLADYLGLPCKRLLDIARHSSQLYGDEVIHTLDFIAYQLIWHYWYQPRYLDEWKDYEENNVPYLRQLTSFSGSIGSEIVDMLSLKYAPWELDYFTRCTREPQLGDPVQFPFSGQAPVVNGNADFDHPNAVVNTLLRDVYTAVDIERWLTKQNAAQGDYRETILQHFGVWNNDGRLQRPEYLGQTSTRFLTSEVAATADSESTNVGDLSGKSQVFDSSRNFEYSPTEHGVIIGLSYILPETMYFQGLDRHFTRLSTFDWPFPEFQNLDNQAVKESEIYLCSQADTQGNDDIFGYQERYGEFKQKTSTIHGYMTDYLNYWNMARDFGTAPTLGPTFNTCYPWYNNLNRAFSTITDNSKVNTHNFELHFNNRCTAIRPFDYGGQPHTLIID